MSGIKYYQLGDGEELPEEFCAIRNVNGEPDEYAWYEPMDSFDRELWGIFKDNDWVVASEYRKLMADNAKLLELCADLRFCKRNNCLTCSHGRFCDMGFDERCAELRVEVDA